MPRSRVFQAMFESSLHSVGRPASGDTLVPDGPRQPGQFSPKSAAPETSNNKPAVEILRMAKPPNLTSRSANSQFPANRAYPRGSVYKPGVSTANTEVAY